MAHVVIENGALQGQKFDIRERLVVGRHSSCDVVLPIPGVSRRHCQITQVNNTFVLEDLESRNGTYLNGAAVRNSPMTHNDVLNVSRFVIRFIDPAATDKPAGNRTVSVTSVVLDDDRKNVGQSMSIDATVYPSLAGKLVDHGSISPPSSDETIMQPDQIVTELQKRLDIFYQVAQTLSSSSDEDELLGEILECLFSIYPQADRAFLTTGKHVDALDVRAVRYRDSAPADSGPIRLSRSVIQDVFRRREALLISDMEAEEDYAHAESIISQNLRSIMCVPLLVQDELYGIIQIENSGFDKPFTGEDLNLLVGVAVQAALFLSNSRLVHQVAVETSRRSHLQRFFSPAVAKEVMNNNLQLGGELKNGCIMFSDIVGYTARSENVDAAEIIRDLNQYFGVMVGLILAEKGTVDKFGGDAIMAVWGAPVAIKDDAAYAISCSLQMQNAVVRFNQTLRQQGKPKISMGIGLHAGEFVAGNIGSQERMEYTVIGEHVNTAARVESKTVGHMVMISEAMVQRGASHAVYGTRFLPVPMKGMSEPVALSSVRGLKTEDGILMSIPATIQGCEGKITFYNEQTQVFKFVSGGDLAAGPGPFQFNAPEFDQNGEFEAVVGASEDDDFFYDFTFTEMPPVLRAMFAQGIVDGGEISWDRS